MDASSPAVAVGTKTTFTVKLANDSAVPAAIGCRLY
jgi:uncharacterized repeat protein (TIGR01451 family)